MRRILFLAHRIPYPPDRGDKIRAFHIAKHLARNARVHVVAFADDAHDMEQANALRNHVADVTVIRRTRSTLQAAARALLRGRPVSLTAFEHRAMHHEVRDMLGRGDIDMIYVFSGQMAQYLPAAPPQVVMDFVDMDSAKFAAYADAASPPISWMHAREARMLGAFEREVARRADATLFVSAAEAALFRDHGGTGWIAAIENGIDTDFYDPQADFPAVPTDAPLIVFTGQMDYRPNVEAAVRFADHVLPIVRRRHADARFAVVGRRPVAAVRALDARDGVVVTGEVDDVRSWLGAATISVAPLEIARGVQNKVLEAMAMARPVVASIAAAQGIDHGDTIRTAVTAQQMADAIVALLDAPEQARTLGRAARRRVERRYGWDARLAPLDTLIDGICARERAA